MVSGSQIRPTILLVKETDTKKQKVRINSFFFFFFQSREAAPVPNKRIIKYPGDKRKTKHINQFVPLIMDLFQSEGRILFSNEIFTV